ncbi:MAG: preprotein translocase subunit SecG [Sulfurimonas sp.]|uniref:preprotein translocase subunit SecG n=1 Tax=Sulfurimonas sp. TaxID=2022749 RepID=UPI002621C357|nr:preprotein translocase subunit SecG [Sulfurimonas sp.]MDD2651937.1 preprotein translocase subunit SecG [Sulfurimonas sp.]MDD3451937.1 preprotein translocase subunit SecG [Sulfurimonas sp.]
MTASFLLIVQIVLVVMLVIAVLLQKSSSIGLGAYSGSNESVFGAKGPASFLAKTTFTIGFLFVINTLALGYIYASNASESVVDNIVEKTNITAPATPLPAATKVEAPAAAVPNAQEQNSSTGANSTTQK